MENYRKKVRKRIIFAGVYCAIVLILTAAAQIMHLDDSVTSFNLGFGFGIGAVVIFFMIRYRGALKSEDKLKKLYIEENDERQKHINSQVGHTGMNISIMSLALAMLVSNYFNRRVFFTLLAATLFIVAVKAVLSFYYNKKV